MPRVKISGQWHKTNRGGDLVIWIAGRRIRLGAYYGAPPGAHIGFWRTRGGFTGDLQGLNLRIGRRYVGPALTLLAHVRSMGRPGSHL